MGYSEWSPTKRGKIFTAVSLLMIALFSLCTWFIGQEQVSSSHALSWINYKTGPVTAIWLIVAAVAEVLLIIATFADNFRAITTKILWIVLIAGWFGLWFWFGMWRWQAGNDPNAGSRYNTYAQSQGWEVKPTNVK